MSVVFLDRDGIINRNQDDYVKTIDEFEFLPGVFEGLALLRAAGFVCVVISNQAGVGKGLINPGELDRIDQMMVQEIARNGGEIAATYYCTHRNDEHCSCRKPETGLLESASRNLGFDLGNSFLIGDAASDIEAGVRAGCRTIFVLTGRTQASAVKEWRYRPDYMAVDLPRAATWIISCGRHP